MEILRDLLITGGVLASVVGLLVWLVKDGQRRQSEMQRHYEERLRQISDSKDARVVEVTDQFVAELRGNREAALARRAEDRQMHDGYQRMISEQTDAIKVLTAEVRELTKGQSTVCRNFKPESPDTTSKRRRS